MSLPIVSMWALLRSFPGYSCGSTTPTDGSPLWGIFGDFFFFFFLFEAYASFDTMVYLSLHLRYKGAAPSISFAGWCQSRILYVTSLCCSRLWLHSRHKSCNRVRGPERYEPLWGSYLPRLSLITSCTKYACGVFFSDGIFIWFPHCDPFHFIHQFTAKWSH